MKTSAKLVACFFGGVLCVGELAGIVYVFACFFTKRVIPDTLLFALLVTPPVTAGSYLAGMIAGTEKPVPPPEGAGGFQLETTGATRVTSPSATGATQEPQGGP